MNLIGPKWGLTEVARAWFLRLYLTSVIVGFIAGMYYIQKLSLAVDQTAKEFERYREIEMFWDVDGDTLLKVKKMWSWHEDN